MAETNERRALTKREKLLRLNAVRLELGHFPKTNEFTKLGLPPWDEYREWFHGTSEGWPGQLKKVSKKLLIFETEFERRKKEGLALKTEERSSFVDRNYLVFYMAAFERLFGFIPEKIEWEEIYEYFDIPDLAACDKLLRTYKTWQRAITELVPNYAAKRQAQGLSRLELADFGVVVEVDEEALKVAETNLQQNLMAKETESAENFVEQAVEVTEHNEKVSEEVLEKPKDVSGGLEQTAEEAEQKSDDMIIRFRSLDEVVSWLKKVSLRLGHVVTAKDLNNMKGPHPDYESIREWLGKDTVWGDFLEDLNLPAKNAKKPKLASENLKLKESKEPKKPTKPKKPIKHSWKFVGTSEEVSETTEQIPTSDGQTVTNEAHDSETVEDVVERLRRDFEMTEQPTAPEEDDFMAREFAWTQTETGVATEASENLGSGNEQEKSTEEAVDASPDNVITGQGVEGFTRYARMTHDELVAWFRAACLKYGRMITSTDLSKMEEGHPSYSTLVRHLGTYDERCKYVEDLGLSMTMADVNVTNSQDGRTEPRISKRGRGCKWFKSKDEAVKWLRDTCAQQGHLVSTTDIMHMQNAPSMRTLLHWLGPYKEWSSYVMDLDLRPRQEKPKGGHVNRVSYDDCLKALRSVYERNGHKCPTVKDVTIYLPNGPTFICLVKYLGPHSGWMELLNSLEKSEVSETEKAVEEAAMDVVTEPVEEVGEIAVIESVRLESVEEVAEHDVSETEPKIAVSKIVAMPINIEVPGDMTGNGNDTINLSLTLNITISFGKKEDK